MTIKLPTNVAEGRITIMEDGLGGYRIRLHNIDPRMVSALRSIFDEDFPIDIGSVFRAAA